MRKVLRCCHRAALFEGSCKHLLDTVAVASLHTVLSRCAASFSSCKQHPRSCFTRVYMCHCFTMTVMRNFKSTCQVPLIPQLKEGGDVRFGNVDLKAALSKS